MPWTCSRRYLQAVKELCDLDDPSKSAIVADWEKVLVDLGTDPMRCRDRLDWAAKLALIREFQASQNVGANDPWLQSLDLEYHRLDREKGLYYALEQSGSILGVPDDAAVRRGHFPNLAPHHAGFYVRRSVHPEICPCRSLPRNGITLPFKAKRGPLKISLLSTSSRGTKWRRTPKVVDAAKCPDDLESIAELHDRYPVEFHAKSRNFTLSATLFARG